MNVLLITDYSPSWESSPSSRLLHLAQQLACGEHNVRVVGSRSETPPSLAGIEVIALPFKGQGGIAQGLFPFRSCVRKHLRWCDAVIARGYWVAFAVFLFTFVQRKRYRIFDFHGYRYKEQAFDGCRVRSLLTWLIEWITLRLSTAVIAVSDGVASDIPLGHPLHRLILPNGIDEQLFSGNLDDAETSALNVELGLGRRPVFAVIARFVPWIRADEVVRAAALLGDVAEIIFVGSGPGLVEARRESEKLGTDNVRFVGKLSHHEVCILLRKVCTGAICPYDGHWINSRKPGYYSTRKVREYMASELPLVVADVPGKESFLKDGETCLLYRAGSSEDMAEKVRQLVEDPQTARRIASASARVSKELTWKSICRKSGLLNLLYP